MAALTGDFDAFPEMGHEAVDAEELIAMPKPLTLRVDQEQERTPGMRADGSEHAGGHRQGEFDADFGMFVVPMTAKTLPPSDLAASRSPFLLDPMASRKQSVGYTAPRVIAPSRAHRAPAHRAQVIPRVEHGIRLASQPSAPNLERIGMASEHSIRAEHCMLAFHGLERERFGPHQRDECFTELRDFIVDQTVAIADQ
jgi:hypothetical protein